MSLLSIPNVFATGTVINAAPFNANFNAVVSSVNNIDNTNIGSAGLYATNFNPTTMAQATFGGAIGWTFTASGSAVPLTVLNPATGANPFAVTNAANTVDYFHISSSGRSNVTAGLVFPVSTVALAPTVVELINDNAATGGLILNVPTGSTNGWQFQTNGTTVLSINAAGAFNAVTSLGGIISGSTAGSAGAGVIWASSSANTGTVNIGGTTSTANLTYSGSILIINKQVNSTVAFSTPGTVTAFSGLISGNGTTTGAAAFYSGTGAPTFGAWGGSVYLRSDGTPGTNVFYTNTSGATTFGTTWTAHF